MAGKGPFGGATGKGGHGKPGSTDKGRGGNIDRHGRPGKHHGGFLSGGKKGGDGKGGTGAAAGNDRWG